MGKHFLVICSALAICLSHSSLSQAVPPTTYAAKSEDTLARLADAYVDYADKLVAVGGKTLELTRERNPRYAQRIERLYASYLSRWHNFTTNLINRVAGNADTLLTRINADATLNADLLLAQNDQLTKIDDSLASALSALREARTPSGEISVGIEDLFTRRLFRITTTEVLNGDTFTQTPLPYKTIQHRVVITNTGLGDLTIESVTAAIVTSTSNLATVGFAEGGDIPDDTVIPAGESVTLTLEYSTTDADTIDVELTINNDDPDDNEDPFVVTLALEFVEN
jgi:hypothetical protein